MVSNPEDFGHKKLNAETNTDPMSQKIPHDARAEVLMGS
jgi:hypothetical protein